MIATSLSDGVHCTHSSYVANSMYKLELNILNSVSCTQCRVVSIQSERPIEASLSDGVNCTHISCVADLLYTGEVIILGSVYYAQCRVVNI